MFKLGKRPQHGYKYHYADINRCRQVCWDDERQVWRKEDLDGAAFWAIRKCFIGALVRHDREVRPVLYMTEEEAIAACKETLRKNFNDDNPQVSRYSVMTKRDRQARHHLGACHSYLNRHEGGAFAFVTAPSANKWGDADNWTGNRHREERRCQDVEKFKADCSVFWNWLTQLSPLCGVFKENVDEHTAAVEGIAINTKTPARVAMLAVIASRWPFEYPNRVTMWAAAVEAGCDPWHALALAEMTKFTGDAGAVKIGKSGCIHDIFSASEWTRSTLERFVRRDYHEPGDILAKSTNFYGVHKVFGPLKDDGHLVGELNSAKRETVQERKFCTRTLEVRSVTTKRLTIEGVATKMTEMSKEWAKYA